MAIDEKFKEDIVDPKVIEGIKRFCQYDKNMNLGAKKGEIGELKKLKDEFDKYLSGLTYDQLKQIFDYCVLEIRA